MCITSITFDITNQIFGRQVVHQILTSCCLAHTAIFNALYSI